MPDDKTINAVLSSYGLSNFLNSSGGINWWSLLAGTVFGIVGWFAFWNGKKEKSWRAMVIGIVLMVYTFFVANAWAVTGIGLALCAALYFWRE